MESALNLMKSLIYGNNGHLVFFKYLLYKRKGLAFQSETIHNIKFNVVSILKFEYLCMFQLFSQGDYSIT